MLPAFLRRGQSDHRGLAEGREIKGNIVHLGGPLTFLSELRKSFDETLRTQGDFPGKLFVLLALGAAFSAEEEIDLDQAIDQAEHYQASGNFAYNPPLFQSQEDYGAFLKRHGQCSVKRAILTPIRKSVLGHGCRFHYGKNGGHGRKTGNCYIPNTSLTPATRCPLSRNF